MQNVIPLEIADDEVLIVTFKQTLTDKQFSVMQEQLNTAIHHAAKIVCIDMDPTFYVVKRDALARGEVTSNA